LASHTPHIQRVVNQVICFNQPCTNVSGLNNFLATLEKDFHSTASYSSK